MTPIAAPLIPLHWPFIWKILQPAVERGGEHTERSVLTALLHGGMVLWVDAGGIEEADAALVTSWCDYPAGRIGFAQFAGGANAQDWIIEAIDTLSAWARGMGCKELRLIGRKGWGKLIEQTPSAYIYSRML